MELILEGCVVFGPIIKLNSPIIKFCSLLFLCSSEQGIIGCFQKLYSELGILGTCQLSIKPLHYILFEKEYGCILVYTIFAREGTPKAYLIFIEE
jgi:hypothetical protein